MARRDVVNGRRQMFHSVLMHRDVATLEQLAEVTKRSVDWAGDRFSELAAAGVLRRSRRGAPYALGPASGGVLSMALGTESLRAGWLDPNGVLHHRHFAPALRDQLLLHPSKLLARMREAAVTVLSAALGSEDLTVPSDRGRSLPIHGVAVAWPTPLDRDGRPYGHALSDGLWAQKSMRTHVADALGVPFNGNNRSYAVNDANAAVLAFAFQVALKRASVLGGAETPNKRSQILMAVRLSGGIGAGTIELVGHERDRFSFVDARLIGGSFAGEIGHLPIASSVVDAIHAERDPEDSQPLTDIDTERRCSCGVMSRDLKDSAGHLEVVAGAWAIIRRLEASGVAFDPDRSAGVQLTEMLDSRRDEAVKAVADAGRLIGHAITGPILMFDPARILLTGYLGRDEVKAGIDELRAGWAPRNGLRYDVRIETQDDDHFHEVLGAGLTLLRDRGWRLEADEDPVDRAANRLKAPAAFTRQRLRDLRALAQQGS